MQSHPVTALIRHILIFPAIALAALMLPVSAASAHDSLTGTTPKEGQTLGSIPEAVELTFTDVPIGLGTEVVVEGPDGTDRAVGEPEIVDNTVTQPISADAPAGNYTVTWRVVSSDSHPIEGTFEFTAKAGGPGGSDGAEGSAANSSGSGSVQSDTPAAGAEDPESGQSESAFPTSFIIVLGALLVAVVIFIAVLARRRLKKPDDLG